MVISTRNESPEAADGCEFLIEKLWGLQFVIGRRGVKGGALHTQPEKLKTTRVE